MTVDELRGFPNEITSMINGCDAQTRESSLMRGNLVLSILPGPKLTMPDRLTNVSDSTDLLTESASHDYPG